MVGDSDLPDSSLINAFGGPKESGMVLVNETCWMKMTN